MTSPWKIEHLRRPLFPLTRGKKNWYRVFISPSPPPPQVKFQRKPPSRFSVQSHRNFYIFLHVLRLRSTFHRRSIFHRTRSSEYISFLEEEGQSGGRRKASNSWNFSTSIITSSTHCAWEFSNGVHRTIFSRCVGMYPFSKGKARATNEYTLLFLSLSLSREREIRRTKKKDEIAVSSRRLFLV